MDPVEEHKLLIQQEVISLASQKAGQSGPVLLIVLATLFCFAVGNLLIGIPLVIAGLVWSRMRNRHDSEIDGKIKELNKQFVAL